MASTIRVLNDAIINKIAAGEVIENPASVVKELVENALDAEATDISVEIKGGGRQLIRITDNGKGMNEDDALLSLERHATSKICSDEDIFHINTMGFRGEAIPSIASISKFSLLTAQQANQVKGTLVIVEGGKIMKCAEAPRNPGTTVEVKSLFFNVPVRRKFQRSPVYDVNEIQKLLHAIALANPQVKIEFINQQTRIFSTTPLENECFIKQLEKRIRDLLGDSFAELTCPFSVKEGDMQLEGYIGLPSHTRQNRSGQYIFINKRAVSSPMISYAVREGYGTMLPSNRHPVYVLHMTIPGDLVDVNVHPQKKEVRLRQELTIKKLIIQAVDQALHQNEAIAAAPLLESEPAAHKTLYSTPSFEKAPFFAEDNIRPATPPQTREPETFAGFTLEEEKETQAKDFQIDERNFIDESEPALPTIIATIKGFIIVDPATIPLLTGSDGICLIDQRRAHARLVFDALLKDQEHLATQALLFPYTFELTPTESNSLRAELNTLNAMGIELKEFGSNSFVVDALPEILGQVDIEAFIHEICKGLTHDEEGCSWKGEMQKRIALLSSRLAVSAGRKLGIEEANHLLTQLLKSPQNRLCPSGKPTMMHLKHSQLIKLFTTQAVL